MSAVRLERHREQDLPLLQKLLGDPAMMQHLGGAETPEKIVERHGRYVGMTDAGEGLMFTALDAATGEPVGHVGYWAREWRGDQVYETGWFVLPAFQGRGIAVAATGQMIDSLKPHARHRFLHAWPSVDNPPSNAICRKLGFELIEECDVEYPPGSHLRVNDWRYDLYAT